MTIRAKVSALIRSLGELSAAQAVLAETARRLAAALDDPDSASYALPGMSRELRAVLAELTTAPGARGLVGDDLDVDLRRLLHGGAS